MREHHGLIAAWVGERLKILRGRETQGEFAARLGLRQEQYNRYETGKRLAPDRVIESVAALKGLTPAQVLWGQEAPAAPSAVASGPPLAQAVAQFLELLDREGLEDLFFFLKRKTEDLARQRRQEAKKAHAALEALKQAAGGV